MLRNEDKIQSMKENDPLNEQADELTNEQADEIITVNPFEAVNLLGRGDDYDSGSDIGNQAPEELESARYSTGQKILQFSIEWAEALAPTYFADHCMPTIPFPFNGMLIMGAPALNDSVNGVLRSLVSKEEPLSGLRAEGNGKVAYGVLKESTTKVAAIATVAIAGYLYKNFVFGFLLDLSEYENGARNFANIVTSPPVERFILGTMGYFAYKGIVQLGMNMWNKCIPSQEEFLPHYPVINAAQEAGKNLMRVFTGLSFVDTLAYYLQVAGKQSLVRDPNILLALMVGVDGVIHLLKHIAYHPHPITASIAKEYAEEERRKGVFNGRKTPDHPIPIETTKDFKDLLFGGIENSLVKNTMNAVLMYSLGQIMCKHGSSMCKGVFKNDWLAKTAMITTSMGPVFLANQVVPAVMPHIISGVSKCWGSMFNRNNSTAGERQPILENTQYDRDVESFKNRKKCCK